MSGHVAKPSPLSELCSALPSLPLRLREVGRFVAAHDYDAATRAMRDRATVAGADPAAFTRLAKALGYSGWDELRSALTEARRPTVALPFSGRARGRRQGPNPEISLVSDKFEAEAAGLTRISPAAVVGAAKALHAARRNWLAGFRSCRSVAGAIGIARWWAAATFTVGGPGAKRRLEETEARLAASSQYVAERD